MTPRFLKRFLMGVASIAGLAVPSIAAAHPTCVYVFTHLDGFTVSTPAVPVYVPALSALADPIRVHVDETAQNILGYSLNLPGLDLGTEGTPLFALPELGTVLPPLSFTLPEINYNPYRCIDIDGVEVPAIPVKLPASSLVLPGFFADIGEVIFNIGGEEIKVLGKLFRFNGKQIIFPELNLGTPAIPVGTPQKSIELHLDGSWKVIRYLAPN
ncbi:hypothetical protein SAMN05444354_113163 [Stigmatella aurantiaca]|uniref:Uncharacterized protein n=1 Tax=Stigmatella aurantiaca TaxID=41 RepID=A0A1H7WTW4_STIAU|nr:hypothetical protein [Stigmatella aurantiaca]SEM24359.1 hypothetical protein SAMN05444354_113163 [Stigmatella aurantiaca]